MSHNNLNRRSILKHSLLGMFLPLIPTDSYGDSSLPNSEFNTFSSGKPHENFPNIDPEIVSEVVGKSHFNLERVKELVDKRPELARATWEWRFGDWESAIGAASHVGRRDIAKYLLEKGARPDIFTFAMLGATSAVKSQIEFFPGIQSSQGPHGISLLRHAKAGLRMKDKMSMEEQDNQKRLIEYLELLGDAGGKTYEEVSAEQQKKYLGDYKYGEGATEGFSVKLNMQKLLSIGPINGFGGSILKIGDNKFTYSGSPSVTVSFEVIDTIVKSLTLTEPELSIKAQKVSY